MSRIANAFAGKKGSEANGANKDSKGNKAFIAFVTGGDPTIEHTERYVMAMIEAGADLIEIGIPFSDPIAEGPVIQAANLRALAAGANLDKLLALVKRLRMRTQVPIVFMGYLNSFLHYGYERLCAAGSEAGLDGLIVADLPFDEKGELDSIAASHDLDLISLIAPTSASRITTIAAQARGFIYLVSSMGVTGVRSQITTDIDSIVAAIRSATNIPIAVGFGVHSPKQAAELGAKADGIIVGSAIVRQIAEHVEAGTPDAAIKQLAAYVHKMKFAMQ